MLSGPGFRTSDFDSNLIIGTNQFNGAKTLMSSTLPSVSGAVRSLHSYVNMLAFSLLRFWPLSADRV